ncbi:DUF6262 family protein [Nonomuraea sp. NPDC000554]|uniref:DUF6262 family protein n=1 Tax=Nonomuraea sp. NPDC000554 TaxID=3154259 RepID=UPI0033209778
MGDLTSPGPLPAEHVHHLAEHARQRHERTLRRAQQTLTELADTGQPVTVATLATQAGVSRSWIYTQPELRERIQHEQHRQVRTDAVRGTVTRASDDSLRQRLTLAHERISRLRAENQQLRDALALAHGQLRAARLNSEG